MHERKEAAGSLSLMALPSEESQSHIKLIGPWRRTNYHYYQLSRNYLGEWY